MGDNNLTVESIDYLTLKAQALGVLEESIQLAQKPLDKNSFIIPQSEDGQPAIQPEKMLDDPTVVIEKTLKVATRILKFIKRQVTNDKILNEQTLQLIIDKKSYSTITDDTVRYRNLREDTPDLQNAVRIQKAILNIIVDHLQNDYLISALIGNPSEHQISSAIFSDPTTFSETIDLVKMVIKPFNAKFRGKTDLEITKKLIKNLQNIEAINTDNQGLINIGQDLTTRVLKPLQTFLSVNTGNVTSDAISNATLNIFYISYTYILFIGMGIMQIDEA